MLRPHQNAVLVLTFIQPLKNDRFRIPKSRYDSVDLYISPDWINRPEYNDNHLPYDESIYNRLREHGTHKSSLAFHQLTSFLGLDDLLSKHISHLFIRDPLVVFTETIDQDDSSSTDHFEVSYFDYVVS